MRDLESMAEVIKDKRFDFGYGNIGYRLIERNKQEYLILIDGAEIEIDLNELVKQIHHKGAVMSAVPRWRILLWDNIPLIYTPLISIKEMEKITTICYDNTFYTIYVLLGSVFSPLYNLYVVVAKDTQEMSRALCN